ncbi:MAG TPA: alpha/beta fold hydrolase [Acidisphaera sp.]|nr:alpha/beta fold hydrolase [Acidisphaera sp.]
MTAFWLRVVLTAAALWWFVSVLLLDAAGLGFAAASIAVMCGTFVGIVVFFAIRYALALSDPGAMRRALQAGVPRALAGFFGEVLAFLAAFVVIQPFERLWMGDEPAQARVLLVHGYACNRGAWWWLRRRLRRRGIDAGTVNLEPPFAGIDALADALHRRIEALGTPRLLLVGHSMGGLVCRAYLRRYGAGRVAGLVTLATPHRGTRIARLGIGQDAREMLPGNGWLRGLGAPTVPTHAVWSSFDVLVVPQESGHLDGARETVLPVLGHLAFLFSPRVLAVLEAEAARSL